MLVPLNERRVHKKSIIDLKKNDITYRKMNSYAVQVRVPLSESKNNLL